jgi:hypothetical protein
MRTNAVSLPVRPVSQVVPRSLEWLWPGHLALGKLAILDGDPGLGKSLLALDFCARLSTGRPWPDGTPSPSPAACLVLNGEDGEDDTVLPRLQTLGADLDRVFVWHRQLAAPLSLPSQAELLGEALDFTRARLLVIDPIMAFLDANVLSASDQSIRRALFPLYCLAEKHSCVPLMVRHLNKTNLRRALYRGGGSIGLAGACRSAWLVGADPHQSDRRVLAQVKNNLAGPQPSLAYTVCAEGTSAPTLSWLGPCPWSADQLVGPAPASTPTAHPREGARGRAREFLLDFLAGGGRTAREVWTAAQQQGLAERTLNRAKTELEIRSVRITVDGVPASLWLLPGQAAPEDAPPDLEAWLGPMRQRFPVPTPLDDL